MRENIGFPVVRTDGRAYGHVITKFSWMGRLPHFLSYGAPGGAPLIIIIIPLFIVGSIYSTYAIGAEQMIQTNNSNQT